MKETLRGDPNQEGMDWVYMEDTTGTNPFWLEVVGDVYFDEEKQFLDSYGSGMDHLSFFVDDANAICQTVRSLGEKIVIEPFGYGDMRMFYIKDPSGLMVQLIQISENPG